jgi:hypothetical protein
VTPAAQIALSLLDDPQFVQRFKELLDVRGQVLAALTEREHDCFLSPQQAAYYVYGAAGKEQAFAKMRRRHPELDAASIGSGKRRRWRRSDLAEVWGRLNPGFLRS